MSNPIQLTDALPAKQDFAFFTPLGMLLAFLMVVLNKLNLPAQMDRGTLLDILFDHVPFLSLVLILASVMLFVSVDAFLTRFNANGKLVKLTEHLAFRSTQFCGPAVTIMLGFSFAVLLYALISNEKTHFSHFAVFLCFTVFILFINAMTIRVAHFRQDILTKFSPLLGAVSALVFIIVVLTISFTDDSDKEVTIKLDLYAYKQIQEVVKQQEDLTVEDFIRLSALSKLGDLQ